jgi:hypothetical protein
VHGAGETFSAKYRIYLQPAHRRGLLLYVGPRVRPPAASPLTEYGGTIGSMFGMMLEASPFDERLYPEGQKP